MILQVAKADGWSASYNEDTERYSLDMALPLDKGNELVVSSMLYEDCKARAEEKGVSLKPVAFGGWKSIDGKDVTVTPKGSGWEVEAGGNAQAYPDLGSVIRAAQARTLPTPKKAFVAK